MSSSRMENYQGDLADIVRASAGGTTTTTQDESSSMISGWNIFPSSDLMNFQSDHITTTAATAAANITDDFGDPFSDMRDPLLHVLNSIPPNNSTSPPPPPPSSSTFFDDTCAFDGGEMMMKKRESKESSSLSSSSSSSNIFSRLLQISPNPKSILPVAAPPQNPPMASSSSSSANILNMNNNNNNNSNINGTSSSANGCIIENTGMQISSPRNPACIKRRKSQAKKVVCIPAPAPANSRSTGEVVPSDLWAWRKYGQKPIKGSPYPRGYYRCSSSKGCSARKQVERSRTDPNMLVITYTSEHNHPWPTQRNALAGSTRSQPSLKNNSKNSPTQQPHKTSNLTEDHRSSNDHHNNVSSTIKEEMEEDIENQLEMDHEGGGGGDFHLSYKPEMPSAAEHEAANLQQQSHEDFFADLGEIEADPLDHLLLMNQEFRGPGDHDHDHEHEDIRESNKALDLFSIFDWSGGNNNTSYGGRSS